LRSKSGEKYAPVRTRTASKRKRSRKGRKRPKDLPPQPPKYDFTVPRPPPRASAVDQRELRRLVRDYGREVVAALAGKVSPRGPGRPPRGFKPPELPPPLAPLDAKELARQVRKFGPEAVAYAAKIIPMRGVGGRPPRRGLPEGVFLAQWLEQVAHEYRCDGHGSPYKHAEIDLYELQYGGEEERRDLQRFRKTIKKQRLQGGAIG
jgi:hypothetical protein